MDTESGRQPGFSEPGSEPAKERSWLASALRRIAYKVGIVVVLIFFGLAAYELAPALLAYEWQVEPWPLVLAALIVVARGPVAAFGWQQIMSHLGHALTLRTSLRLVFHSALANYIPGSMWHVVSRVVLAQRLGIPRSASGASMLLETLLVLAGAVLVACLSLLVWRSPPSWMLILTALGLIAGALLLARPGLLISASNWVLRRFRRNPLSFELTAPVLLRLLAPYLLNWLLYGTLSFATVAALYPALQWTTLPGVAGLFCAAWLAGYVAVFVPQGLVVREAAVVALLTGLVGVPAPAAAASAVLSRLWTILGTGLWSLVALRR